MRFVRELINYWIVILENLCLCIFRVEYILNVTKEIDNFFPGIFKYCNVRVYDYEETELVRHWNNTFKFIAEAKWDNQGVID